MAAIIGNQAETNVSPFARQQQNNGGGRGNFQKSDRLLNLNIPTVNEDGSQGYTKLCVGGFRMDDPMHATLIEWIDKNPEKNIPILLAEMAKVSTWVDVTKKKERGFGFIK